MHVCLVSPTIISKDSHWGGIHTHAKLLSHLLSRLDYAVTLIVPSYSENPSDKFSNNVNIVGLNELQKNTSKKTEDVLKIVNNKI